MEKINEERINPDKVNRVLGIYNKLVNGGMINKAEEASNYGVNERTIQRDIDDIRAFLKDDVSSYQSNVSEVIYDRIGKGYFMTGIKGSMLSNSEILAVSKILLDSRAFRKNEIEEILDKIVQGCVPYENSKLVSELISNEKFHYVQLENKELVQEKLWDIGLDIHEHNLVRIKYARASDENETIDRTIEPLSIIFSEYYFYLNAFIVKEDETGEYRHMYDYPAVFRVDRIKKYKRLNKKFRLIYANRFEEGEFRKRIQFMYPGKLMKIKFRYYGLNAEPVLDRLPTARVLSREGDSFIIEAEVFGKGCLMWILSQGEKIEVLSPENFREEVIVKLNKMLDLYK